MAVCWMLWLVPFVRNGVRGKGKAEKIATSARYGILLEGLGFALANMGRWDAPLALWRAALALVAALAGIALTWTAVAQLGRQWRVDAGLNTDHELVQGGAYRFIRHPIYLSLLMMLLFDAACVGVLPLWPLGVLVYLAGTEIRVRIEDGLLRERFGTRFTEWASHVPAYLPLIR